MKFRILGNTGLQVSELGIGSMTFGGQTKAWDARQMLDKFINEGGNFVDTSSGYNLGEAEKIIGQWMADGGHRPYVVLATKTYHAEDQTPNHRGLSRAAILHSVEQSLQRLQTDYIDVYYTNYWDNKTPPEETLRALEQLVQQGKVRYVACSNYFAWQVVKALGIQSAQGWSPYIAIQAHYSLMERSLEHETLSMIGQEHLGIVAYSPLAGGFLTGKFQPGKPLDEDTRLGAEEGVLPKFYRDLCLNPRGWDILGVVNDLAYEKDVKPAHVALAWVLKKPFIASVLLGASQIHHIDENLESVKLRLSKDDMQRLDDVSRLDLGYPNTIYEILDELP